MEGAIFCLSGGRAQGIMKTSAHTSHECFIFKVNQTFLLFFSVKAGALFFKRCTVKCFSKIILSQSEGQPT